MVNTKLAAWRARQTEEVTLPSGLMVTARRITLEDVIMSGDIPKPLLGMIDTLRTDAIDMTNMERIAEFMPLINHTVRMAIIEPPVADVADDEHLGIDELPAADRLTLFSWLVQPAAKIAPFVRNREELWLLHQVGQTYSSRPSAILNISDSWLAYQMDVATLLLGRRVEALVADGKTTVGEALASFDSGLRPSTAAAASAQDARHDQWKNQRWKDPRPYVSKVMAVPESGIW